jgi:hypothetical protein
LRVVAAELTVATTDRSPSLTEKHFS